MPRYYDERERYRGSPIGYAPQVGGIGYIPRTDPGMTDRLGQVLQQRQERHDLYGHMVSEAIGEFGALPVPLSDIDEYEEWVSHIDEGIRRTVEEDYGGDFGLAGRDITRKLARHKQTVAGVAREAEEEQRYRQIYDQLRMQGRLARRYTGEYDEFGRPVTEEVDPFAQNVFKYEDGQLVRTHERDYGTIRERTDYDSWMSRIAEPLANQVSTELFKRASSPELSAEDRDMYWQDDTIRGFSNEEIDRLVDEGAILTDDTVRKFMEETSWGFEYGTSMEIARDYMKNTLKEQIARSVQSQVRQDPIGVQRRTAREEPDVGPLRVGSVTDSLTSEVDAYGFKNMSELNDKTRELERDGDSRGAQVLKEYRRLVENKIASESPPLLETVQNNPSNRIIELGVAAGLPADLAESLGETILEEVESFDHPTGWDKIFASGIRSTVRTMTKMPAAKAFVQAMEQMTSKDKEAYEKYTKQIFTNILEGAAKKNPQLMEQLFPEAVMEITPRSLMLGLASGYLHYLKSLYDVSAGKIDEENLKSTVQHVFSPIFKRELYEEEVRVIGSLGETMLEGVQLGTDYYFGRGEYEQYAPYKEVVERMNTYLQGEGDITEAAFSYRIDQSTQKRNAIDFAVSNVHNAFEIPKDWERRGALDPSFNDVSWNNIMLMEGDENYLPTILLVGADSKDKTVTFRGRVKAPEGFELLKEMSDHLGVGGVYERALGVMAGRITKKGLTVRDITDHIHVKGTFKELFGEDVESYTNLVIKNEGSANYPLYRIEDSDTGQLLTVDGDVFETNSKFYGLSTLFNLVQGPEGRLMPYEQLVVGW